MLTERTEDVHTQFSYFPRWLCNANAKKNVRLNARKHKGMYKAMAKIKNEKSPFLKLT